MSTLRKSVWRTSHILAMEMITFSLLTAHIGIVATTWHVNAKGCTSASDPVCNEAQDSKCDALHCDIGTCVRRRRIQHCAEPIDTRSGLSQQLILRRQNANPVSGPALPAQIYFGIIASSSQVLQKLETSRRIGHDEKCDWI